MSAIALLLLLICFQFASDSSVAAAVRQSDQPKQLDLVFEMDGAFMPDEMFRCLNDNPLCGAAPLSMVCEKTCYEAVAGDGVAREKYYLRSRHVFYSAGEWNRGPVIIPTTKELIAVRITQWDGRVQVFGRIDLFRETTKGKRP